VNLTVDADLDDVSWKNIVLGQDIESGQLNLLIKKEIMEVTGDARMNGEPVDIKWASYFDGAGPIKARLEAQTTLDRSVVLPFISNDELAGTLKDSPPLILSHSVVPSTRYVKAPANISINSALAVPKV
jgi:hypothetical protein